MANTFVPIQSITLTGTQASVTFSGIPQTYTDLVLRLTLRTSATYVNSDFYVSFNGDSTAANYSTTYLQGTGSVASSSRSTGFGYLTGGLAISAANATANAFGTTEIFLPQYTSTESKPVHATSASESNAATGVLMGATAALYKGTSGISSITITTDAGVFSIGSSFHLYGIKAN